MPTIKLSTCVLSIVLLSACSGGPPPRLYLLESLVDGASVRERRASVEAIGVASVNLPGYARDERLATRVGSHLIRVNDEHRWAEPPEAAITRVFANDLARHSGATVIAEPWPRGFEPEARVELVFDRLLRARDGGADLAGQLRLIDGDGRRLLSVEQFEIRIAATTDDAEAFFVAVAAGLDAVARQAIAALEPPA